MSLRAKLQVENRQPLFLLTTIAAIVVACSDGSGSRTLPNPKGPAVGAWEVIASYDALTRDAGVVVAGNDYIVWSGWPYIWKEEEALGATLNWKTLDLHAVRRISGRVISTG